jgi:DDE superfamily endonuclease
MQPQWNLLPSGLDVPQAPLLLVHDVYLMLSPCFTLQYRSQLLWRRNWHTIGWRCSLVQHGGVVTAWLMEPWYHCWINWDYMGMPIFIVSQTTCSAYRYVAFYMLWTHDSYFQVVNMPNLCIIDYILGPTGSMHNSSASELSNMAKNPAAWFSDHEWVWGDSAYALQPWCIVPYKKPH